MPDTMTPEQRHRCMAAIRGKDTRPEMVVRRWLWAQGYRYRLHVRRLPGTPDIVLHRYHTVINVNGCFWHGHEGCPHFTLPKTRTTGSAMPAISTHSSTWAGMSSPCGSATWLRPSVNAR